MDAKLPCHFQCTLLADPTIISGTASVVAQRGGSGTVWDPHILQFLLTVDPSDHPTGRSLVWVEAVQGGNRRQYSITGNVREGHKVSVLGYFDRKRHENMFFAIGIKDSESGAIIYTLNAPSIMNFYQEFDAKRGLPVP